MVLVSILLGAQQLASAQESDSIEAKNALQLNIATSFVDGSILVKCRVFNVGRQELLVGCNPGIAWHISDERETTGEGMSLGRFDTHTYRVLRPVSPEKLRGGRFLYDDFLTFEFKTGDVARFVKQFGAARIDVSLDYVVLEYNLDDRRFVERNVAVKASSKLSPKNARGEEK